MALVAARNLLFSLRAHTVPQRVCYVDICLVRKTPPTEAKHLIQYADCVWRKQTLCARTVLALWPTRKPWVGRCKGLRRGVGGGVEVCSSFCVRCGPMLVLFIDDADAVVVPLSPQWSVSSLCDG